MLKTLFMPVMFAQHFARNTLRSIFITSPPPAPTQPRAGVPEPALDVDAFLKVNATDKDSHIQITKRISEKKKKRVITRHAFFLFCAKNGV